MDYLLYFAGCGAAACAGAAVAAGAGSTVALKVSGTKGVLAFDETFMVFVTSPEPLAL